MRLQINKLRKRERKKRRAGCALQQQTTQRFNQHSFFSHPRRTFTSTKSTNLCTSILHRRFQPSSTLLSLTRLSHPLGVPRDNPYPETSLASCLVVAAVFLRHNGRRYKCSDKTSRRRHSLPKRASRCLAIPP